VLQHGGSQLRGALSSGEVHAAAQRIPVESARQALLSAYHQAFSTTLNHLMVIGAIVAFVGAVSALVLVRQRDFVIPGSAPSTDGKRPVGVDTPAGETAPAVHA
jgi:hypothetical protein